MNETERMRAFEEFVRVCDSMKYGEKQIIGQGNPKSNILIVGMEPAIYADDPNKEILDNIKNVQEGLKNKDEGRYLRNYVSLAVVVRTGRTASTLLTYCECANDVPKLSPYSFGGLLEYLYFCNQLRNSYDRTRDIQSESQGRLHRLHTLTAM